MVLGLQGSHFAGAINHRSPRGSFGELSSPSPLHFHGDSLALEVSSAHDLDFALTGDQALCGEGFWEARETERKTDSITPSFIRLFILCGGLTSCPALSVWAYSHEQNTQKPALKLLMFQSD